MRKIQAHLWTVVNNYIYCWEKDFFFLIPHPKCRRPCFNHFLLSSTTILNLNWPFTFKLWVIFFFLPVIVFFLVQCFCISSEMNCSERTCWHSLPDLFLESAQLMFPAKVAKRRWFSRVPFKSTVQPRVLKRRWGTTWFNTGAGCKRKSLHLHGSIWTCDVESIFTCDSLAHRDCSSTAPIAMEANGEDTGTVQRERLSVCVWFGRFKLPGR